MSDSEQRPAETTGPRSDPQALGEAATLPHDHEARVAFERAQAALFRREPAVVAVDRFEIRARLGAGGMGVVYSAYDPRLEREVALKLLRAGWADAERAQQQLVQEARTLAKVSHPNVVPIYEVGLHEGDVFIAMELIDGRTLDVWRDESRRSWRQIVRSMLAVARGVAAAHDAGVIHRDLKAHNILVGLDDRPRVVDFGLAGTRAAESAPDDIDAMPEGPTATGGTVGYMAPELFQSAKGTERSDQFAFCVTLWETLYGARPFPVDSLAAYVLAVTDDPLPPVPRRPRVPRAVRAVLHRGLHKDPAQRFDSMHEVAAELKRALDGGTRVRATVAVGLGVAAVAGTWQLRSAPIDPCVDAGREIEGDYDEAVREQIMTSLTRTELPFSRHIARKAVALLDEHARRWSAAQHRLCEARVAAEPDLVARRACLETSREELRAAVGVLREGGEATVIHASRLADLPSPDRCDEPTTLLDRAPMPALHPRVVRAQALERAGRYEDAIALAQAIESEHSEPSVDRANARVVLGRASARVSEFDEARRASEAAVWEAAGLGLDGLAAYSAATVLQVVSEWEPDPPLRPVWTEIARTHAQRSADPAAELTVATVVGNASIWTGEHETARQCYEQALQLAELLHGSQSEAVAQIHHGLGVLETETGRYDLAVEHLDRALETMSLALGPDHPKAATTRSVLGNALFRRGDIESAVEAYEAALSTFEILGRSESPEALMPLTNLAVALGHRGDRERSLALRAEVYARTKAVHGPRSQAAGLAAMNLGASSCIAGDDHAGARLFTEAIEIFEAIPMAATHLARARSNLARAQHRLGRYEDAQAIYVELIEDRLGALGPDHPELVLLLLGHGDTLGALGRLEQARARFRRAVEIADASYPADSPRRIEPRVRWGRFERSHDPDASLAVLREAERLASTMQLPDDLRAELQAALGETKR